MSDDVCETVAELLEISATKGQCAPQLSTWQFELLMGGSVVGCAFWPDDVKVAGRYGIWGKRDHE